MRIVFAAVIAAMASGLAYADDTATVSGFCQKSGGGTAASCDCQAKLIVENSDPKFVQVLVAMSNGKAVPDALKDAGLTEEEFEKMGADAEAKSKDGMEACKAMK